MSVGPQEELVTSNEFGLAPGMVTEVMTLENRLIYVGKVSKVGGNAVYIREINDDELPMVLVNKELKIRFYREEDNVVLRGKVCGSTMRMWKVDRLESTFFKEQRAFFRQSVSTNLEAQCGKRATRGGPVGILYPCQVLDISGGGIFISSHEEYRVGNRLLITNIPLVAEEPTFSFNCFVRRAGLWKKGVIRYGCQFEGLSPKEQDRLLRAIFIVQRMEIRKRKAR